MQTDWLTSDEGAAYLKIERLTLLEWARAGKVKGFQLSGVSRHVWRFRQSELSSWAGSKLQSDYRPCSSKGMQ